MADPGLIQAVTILSKAIYANQTMITLLLHLEIERNAKETGRSLEDVTNEFNARMASIKDRIVEDLTA